MVRATFRFYEELNDFLAPPLRGRDIERDCAAAATTKHMVEALGVPHTEVDLLLVNGESVGFEQLLREGDRVAVYPKFEAFDITPLLKLRPTPLRRLRFVADAHLGALARRLRMTGFDTVFDPALDDADIERLAHAEGRIVLTRDRDLLKRRGVHHGCYVRALDPAAQLREVFDRLDLARSARPFSRCMVCNAPLAPVAADAVAAVLPPRVRARRPRCSRCTGCGQLYWEGSHWQRMRDQVADLLAAVRGTDTKEIAMNEDALNISIRKFLKLVGVSSQREIEHAVQRALADGRLKGSETLPVRATLKLEALQLDVHFDGEIRLQ